MHVHMLRSRCRLQCLNAVFADLVLHRGGKVGHRLLGGLRASDDVLSRQADAIDDLRLAGAGLEVASVCQRRAGFRHLAVDRGVVEGAAIAEIAERRRPAEVDFERLAGVFRRERPALTNSNAPAMSLAVAEMAAGPPAAA